MIILINVLFFFFKKRNIYKWKRFEQKKKIKNIDPVKKIGVM